MKETEFVHKLMYRGMVLRIWAKADPAFPKTQMHQQRDILDDLLEGLDGADPLEAIGRLEWVQAVEVVNHNGDGRIIYPEWP